MRSQCHTCAGLVAVALVWPLVAGCLSYAGPRRGSLYSYAGPLVFEQKNTGSALQAEAFRQPDLLPLYGSSEMRVANPYHPSTLLRTYPTGFTVFPVGKPGTTCLAILQDVAAVGPALRGKKVAVSLTPSWFFEGGMLDAAAYAGNFSRLHAGELVFATALSLPLKQGAARRMLQYPATLKGDPLLRFAVGRLAAGSPPSLALYYAALPLGKLQNLILKVQDHVEVIDFILRQPSLEPILPRRESAHRLERGVASSRPGVPAVVRQQPVRVPQSAVVQPVPGRSGTAKRQPHGQWLSRHPHPRRRVDRPAPASPGPEGAGGRADHPLHADPRPLL